MSRKRSSMDTSASHTPYSARADDIFVKSDITSQITVPMAGFTDDASLRQTLSLVFDTLYGGRCCEHGFVRKGSVSVVSYSAPGLSDAQTLVDAFMTCDLFFPLKGQLLECEVADVNAANVEAVSRACPAYSPFKLFISRDDYAANDVFQQLQPKTLFTARVLDARVGKLDPQVIILGEPVAIVHADAHRRPHL